MYTENVLTPLLYLVNICLYLPFRIVEIEMYTFRDHFIEFFKNLFKIIKIQDNFRVHLSVTKC